MLNMSKFLKLCKFFASTTTKSTSVHQNTLIITQLCKNRPKINVNVNPALAFKKLKNFKIYAPYQIIWTLSILKWMGFDNGDEDKESELILTLKRAVLSTQRNELDKAEQLLHIALRLAQQQMNSQGVLYCYDLMANLAMERLELDKAEKLFVSVMQMLFANGAEQDDIKVKATSYPYFRNTLCMHLIEIKFLPIL